VREKVEVKKKSKKIRNPFFSFGASVYNSSPLPPPPSLSLATPPLSMCHGRQRRRPLAPPVRPGLLLGVHLADDGDVVAADDVQPAEGLQLGLRALPGEHALDAVREDQVDGLVEAAEGARDDPAVVADDGDGRCERERERMRERAGEFFFGGGG